MFYPGQNMEGSEFLSSQRFFCEIINASPLGSMRFHACVLYCLPSPPPPTPAPYCRGGSPPAISKMSIIVSLKKPSSVRGMTHVMEDLITHCNKSIKFYDKPLSGELNIILSRSHTDYKAYICNGNLNLLHCL